jgi:hypothetical protein
MLISYSHRFIFIHVGKSAGMSIRNALMPFCTEPEKFKMRRPPRFKGDQPNPMYTVWETLLLHPGCLDVKRELPPEIFEEFHKFAFVRNPWDHLVSVYYFMLSDPGIPRHAEVKALPGFDAFVQWAIDEAAPFPKGITKLQSQMLTDRDGKLLVDFVGYYEELRQDFESICHHVGIDAPLPHLNRSQHRDYRSCYTDHTRALVEKHFRRDIDLFGYTFDGRDGKVT